MAKIKITKKRRHPVIRFLKHKVLHIEDSPHKIALGMAIGLFIVPNPILGLHILMVLTLCILFKANKFVAITSTCIHNVFTLVLIYYPTYLVGWAVCNVFSQRSLLGRTQIVELFSPSNFASGVFRKEYWAHFWELTKGIGLELWVGSFVVGTAVAIISYGLCYYVVKKHRGKNPHRRFAAHS